MNTPRPTQFELTGESKVGIYGITVHRIRATKDIPKLGIKAGDVGGWVQSLHLLDGSARVGDSAWVGGSAQVVGSARVGDSAQVVGSAQVVDSAQVVGSARVGGSAWVGGSAQVVGSAWVGGSAQVVGSAQVGGSGDDAAVILKTSDYIVVGPIGSESVTATLHRTKGGAHRLVVGCWTGTLGTLMAEVKRRREHWEADQEQQDTWVAQYRALKRLGQATAAMWKGAPQ